MLRAIITVICWVPSLKGVNKERIHLKLVEFKNKMIQNFIKSLDDFFFRTFVWHWCHATLKHHKNFKSSRSSTWLWPVPCHLHTSTFVCFTLLHEYLPVCAPAQRLVWLWGAQTTRLQVIIICDIRQRDRRIEVRHCSSGGHQTNTVNKWNDLTRFDSGAQVVSNREQYSYYIHSTQSLTSTGKKFIKTITTLDYSIF